VGGVLLLWGSTTLLTPCHSTLSVLQGIRQALKESPPSSCLDTKRRVLAPQTTHRLQHAQTRPTAEQQRATTKGSVNSSRRLKPWPNPRKQTSKRLSKCSP
jgi:hypothetical protein